MSAFVSVSDLFHDWKKALWPDWLNFFGHSKQIPWMTEKRLKKNNPWPWGLKNLLRIVRTSAQLNELYRERVCKLWFFICDGSSSAIAFTFLPIKRCREMLVKSTSAKVLEYKCISFLVVLRSLCWRIGSKNSRAWYFTLQKWKAYQLPYGNLTSPYKT